jgi:hypothetical protein
MEGNHEMKPASYPFLAIARKYGLEYAEVLTLADHWRKHPHLRPIYAAISWNNEAINETLNAIDEFRAIQAGLIDWNTGERRSKDVLNKLVEHAADYYTNKLFFGGERPQFLDDSDEMDYGDGITRY